jgi:hypothetical protein
MASTLGMESCCCEEDGKGAGNPTTGSKNQQRNLFYPGLQLGKGAKQKATCLEKAETPAVTDRCSLQIYPSCRVHGTQLRNPCWPWGAASSQGLRTLCPSPSLGLSGSSSFSKHRTSLRFVSKGRAGVVLAHTRSRVKVSGLNGHRNK